MGFDVEAKPNRAKGELNPVALIQITAPDDNDEVLLLHCVAAGVAAAAPERTAELRRVLTDPTIVPVGVGIAADLVHVAESFPRVVAADFAEPPPGEPSRGEEDPSSSSRPSARRPATTSAFLDAFVCSQVVHMFYNRGDPASLAKLAKTLLGLDLPKSRAVQLSDWSRRPLTPIQSKYAADDARVSARVFRAQHAAHAPPDVPLEPWAACFVGLRNEDDLDRRAAEVRDGSFARCPASMRDDFLEWAMRRDALADFAANARRFEAVCRAFIRADAGDPAYASPVQTLRTALQTSEMTGVGTDRRVREAYRTIASAASPSSSADNVWEVAVAIPGAGARELFGGGGVSGGGVRGGDEDDDAFAWSGTGRDYKSAKRSAAAKALAAFRKAADGAWHCEAFVEAAGGEGGGGRGCCAPTRGGEAKARREKVWAACRRRAEREGGGGRGRGMMMPPSLFYRCGGDDERSSASDVLSSRAGGAMLVFLAADAKPSERECGNILTARSARSSRGPAVRLARRDAGDPRAGARRSFPPSSARARLPSPGPRTPPRAFPRTSSRGPRRRRARARRRPRRRALRGGLRDGVPPCPPPPPPRPPAPPARRGA